MNIFEYIQSPTLSIWYNYFLAFIYKLPLISNIIYKFFRLLSISQKLSTKTIIIPTNKDSPLHSYKYQISSNPLHNPSHTLTTHEQQTCIFLSLTQTLFKYILVLSSDSYFYLSIKVFCFGGHSSCHFNKRHPQTWHMKYWSPLWSSLPWCALTSYFGNKNY